MKPDRGRAHDASDAEGRRRRGQVFVTHSPQKHVVLTESKCGEAVCVMFITFFPGVFFFFTSLKRGEGETEPDTA